MQILESVGALGGAQGYSGQEPIQLDEIPAAWKGVADVYLHQTLTGYRSIASAALIGESPTALPLFVAIGRFGWLLTQKQLSFL